MLMPGTNQEGLDKRCLGVKCDLFLYVLTPFLYIHFNRVFLSCDSLAFRMPQQLFTFSVLGLRFAKSQSRS